MSASDGASGFTPPAIEKLNQGLSGYEIINLIACGGMGAVYRARQISLDRLVAIKILPPELAVNETFRKSFEAEGKAMARLSHSNLVGVYDFGEISNMLYLVIEFVEGSNLYESKGDAAIDPEVAVTLIRSVSSGLAEAHRIGLVHRDIKPANILINSDLVPKLGDFGLAVPDSDIESGLMMGTPAYLAPEVMENPSSASFASDTYALGVILYEMLTGSSIERGEVMDLSRVPALGNLRKIVGKAVDPKPLLRFQSGGQLEDVLKEWIRKPRNSGLAMNAGGPVLRPNVAPTVAEASGGGGGLLLGLPALFLIGGLAWFLVGSGSDPDDPSGKTTATPSTMLENAPSPPPERPTIDKDKALEKLRAAQLGLVQGLSTGLAGERRQNRREFLEAAGEEGENLLKNIPGEASGLPRYFLPDEVELGEELLSQLQKYATSRQTEIDRKFQSEISSLHRDSVREIRALKGELPDGVETSWESWVEWLGENPMKVMDTSEAGLWRLSPAPDGFDLQVSSTGAKVLKIGEAQDEAFLTVDGTGEISLNHPAKAGLRFPWKLRWRGDRLEGEDLNGGRRMLRLVKYDYADLLKVPDEPVTPSDGMAEARPDDASPEMEMFKDPEVAALTEKYRRALVGKIEPLEAGYARVLKGFLKTYREQINGTAVEQIEEEQEWLATLNWRGGFTQLETLSPPGELPSDVVNPQTVFRKEFVKRFEPIQRTYLTSLQTMLRSRKFKGRKDIGDIERAIKKVKSPEGAVRARFVKIESLPDEGIRHATIALIEIVDLAGNNLPINNFSKVKVSSVEESSDGRSTVAEKAIDGDPGTFWHTKWKGTRAEFPHWLSFDLGGEHWITGFRITSRKVKLGGRSTDITNWRFHVSPDGINWTVVAEGKFPQGSQTNEHLGFEEIE